MTNQGLTPLSVIYCTIGAFIAFQHPARLAVPSALRAPSLREGWDGFRDRDGLQVNRKPASHSHVRALAGQVFSFVDSGQRRLT